jgi:hypothetical protein
MPTNIAIERQLLDVALPVLDLAKPIAVAQISK